jgi:photosystem II stability/assembly factor-like uncharacterized protein
MKKLFLLIIVHSTLYIVHCFSQQYGWVDISNNLPSSNGTVTLSDMHWISDNEGWICSGFLGEIYHTTDGGQTFETQTTQYSTNAIYMLNSSEGYAGGWNGRVYKTTNGGVNWVVHGSIGNTLLDIDFLPNSDSGYCSGYNGKIYKITSNGISSMSSGVAANLYSISFPGRQGWVCGEQVILHFNGSWVGDQSNPTETYNAIHMDSETTGWVAGDNGVIIHTTNGFNWDYQTNPDSLNRTLNDIFFLTANEGWAIGDGGRLLHTTNAGTNWNIILEGWTTNMLRAVQFTSSTNGYVLGNNKTLFKYGLLTNVEEQPTQPTEFKLEQNYPNPFNPSTRIQYQVSSISQVTLKVFDVLGNAVATLVNEYKPAGSYEVEFNTSSIIHQPSSGIYFYQLKSGEYLQTKKMMLLK